MITGASSGIGRETARLFAENGWTVIATMRDMSKGRDLLKDAARWSWRIWM